MAYTTFTWSEIRARLKDRLELKRFWDDQEYLDAFNEALSAWNLFTGYWKRRETITTVQNQYLYVLSASLLYRSRVTFENLPMTPSSWSDFNNARYTWRSETTASGGSVPTRPMAWAPISLELITIWPADATGGRTLTVDGVSTTPILTADSSTMDLSESLLTTLLGYAQHVLLFKRGGPAFSVTMPLFQTFLQEAAEENDQLKTSNIYRRIMGLDPRGQAPMRGQKTLLDTIAGRSA